MHPLKAGHGCLPGKPGQQGPKQAGGLDYCWPDADPGAGTQDGEGSRVRSAGRQHCGNSHLTALEVQNPPHGTESRWEEGLGFPPKAQGGSALDFPASRDISIHSLPPTSRPGGIPHLCLHPPTPRVCVCLSVFCFHPHPLL